MHFFTEYEKSGAVWMFMLPGWTIQEYHCFARNKFTRSEALAEFAHRYNVKPGDTVIELRAKENKVTPIYLRYVFCNF